MEDIIYLGKKLSDRFNLNYLFKDDKVYLMDNHLAATWCWLQEIDTEKKYNFFHIDRHYDLLYSNLDLWINELKKRDVDLRKISIRELTDIKFSLDEYSNNKFPLFMWDNYIPIFCHLYPETITKYFFATHKDGNGIERLPAIEIGIWELQHSLLCILKETNDNKWIINLDIDYFFSNSDFDEKNYFQFLTNNYILEIADQIKRAMDRIEVLTIALSPELCGGWDNSIQITKLFANHLNINISDSSPFLNA